MPDALVYACGRWWPACSTPVLYSVAVHSSLQLASTPVYCEVIAGFSLVTSLPAVKKASIIETAKASETRPSTLRSFQNLLRRYEEAVENNRHLTEQNASLTRHVKRTDRVVELIAQKVQIEIPPNMLEEEENYMRGTGDGSSHASANLDNNSDGH